MPKDNSTIVIGCMVLAAVILVVWKLIEFLTVIERIR